MQPVTELSNPAQGPAPRISFVSLGGPKALVDSERISLGCAPRATSCAHPRRADAVIVNTCGFLDSAKAESLAAIGKAINENGR